MFDSDDLIEDLDLIEGKQKRKERRSDFESTILGNRSFDLGKTAGSFTLLNNDVKDFSSIEYEEFNYQETKSEFRRLRSTLRSEDEHTKASKLFKNVLDIYAAYVENFRLAEIYFNKAKDADNPDRKVVKYFEDELEKFIITEEDMRRTFYRSIAVVLDKEYLTELIQEFGKLIFYRANSYNTIRSLGYRDDREELEELEEKLELRVHSSDFIENLLQIIELRKTHAANLKFTAFQEYSLFDQEFFNYQSVELDEFLSAVKNYILPIRRTVFDRSMNMFSQEHKLMQESSHIPRSRNEFREYYKENFGDHDWELRNVDKILQGVFEPMHEQEYYPNSKIFNFNLERLEFTRKLIYVSERAIERSARNFSDYLMKRNYINIEYADPRDEIKINSYYLPQSQMTFIEGKINQTSKSISEYIQNIGYLDFNIIRVRAGIDSYLNIEPSAESNKFVTLAYEFMTLSRMGELMEDRAYDYLQTRVYSTVISILNNTMLFEVQKYIYEKENLEYIDLMDKFDLLIKEYRLNDIYPTGINNELMLEIIKYPFNSIIEAIVELSSITVLYEFLDDRNRTRAKFDKFSAISGTDTFIEELKSAKYKNPLDKETIKKLAFDIAKTLEGK